ncbi:MAG: hypothetical protein LDL50_07620 [Chloroflexi bacterium]|nr:hypothetical protein [Chloroflexota bacterium]MCA2003003.1 hypothetical protein [Chloroflexota bacterium]
MNAALPIMKTSTVNFLGLECLTLENQNLKLLISQSAGPRILSLRFKESENLLAELPDAMLDCPGSGKLHLYGGHRLWHAPEEPSRTYQPDDSPVEVAQFENGYLLTQNVEAKTGLQKSMRIQLAENAPQVIITHQLTNHGLWNVTCAPWAITQLKTGGVAILPQTCEDTGVLPNRSLVLWHYTDPSLPNLHWGKNYILFRASVDSPFKVGYPNPRGWLAYWRNGILFVKRAKYEAHSAYFDFGSSSECYCNERFIELETLAPIAILEPGASAAHVETWELYEHIERPQNEEDAQALVEKLKLE